MNFLCTIPTFSRYLPVTLLIKFSKVEITIHCLVVLDIAAINHINNMCVHKSWPVIGQVSLETLVSFSITTKLSKDELAKEECTRSPFL